MKISRRTAFSSIAGAAALPVLTTPAIANVNFKWKMVTSWPKNLPGPGVTAQRLADNITTMSGGRLTVELHPAGSLVPPLETFSAVEGGVAEMAHTAPLFWAGKFSAAPIFTAGPFGLTPLEHITWITHGGGQQLWDELYFEAGIKPFMAGNTGYQMGGWFKNQINSLEDLKGLKIRMPGNGGLVLEKLGATPVSLPPSEILTSLQSGLIDATEFLGPYSDGAMGFHRAAKNYYFPGFHEPNGSGEALVSLEALEALPADLKAIVETACEFENIRSLSEAEWENARELENLQKEHGVILRKYPQEILEAAKFANIEVMKELATRDDLTGRIIASYQNAASHLGKWSDISLKSFLAARG